MVNIPRANSTLFTRAMKYLISENAVGLESGGMVNIQIKDDLPFTEISLEHNGIAINISDVVIDTGSARTIFSADIVSAVGIIPMENDMPYAVRGIGGTEVVFSRIVDYIKADDLRLPGFEIEVGGMDYGFEINGIIGMDFLRFAGAIINLKDMSILFHG